MVFDGFCRSRNPCCVKFVDSFSSAGKLPETSLLPFCFAWKRRDMKLKEGHVTLGHVSRIA